MQLTLKFSIFFFLLCLSFSLNAQEVEPEKTIVESREKIKVDFLANYYDQDGDHSPVTGGKGTESEQVIAPAIIINIPFKKLNILDINMGLDNITSASTDKIDGTSSTASNNDTRVHGNIWYTRKLSDQNQSFGVMGGFSKEFDVASWQTGLRYTFQTTDQNQEISLTAQYFHDTWSLIYPIELRAGLFDKSIKPLSDDTRESLNFSINYSMVFTKDLQGSITTDITQQQGLLSTPFHRVFLDNGSTDIERLPDSRLKVAVGLKLNYFINDYITTRFFYRYYWDDFGISANSFELELPIKINKTLQISPFFRYYFQSQADYFAPYQKNKFDAEFYTSDYDLSNFSSNLYGVALRYSPKLNSWLNKINVDALEFRFSRYNREDGLNANSFSFGFSTSF